MTPVSSPAPNVLPVHDLTIGPRIPVVPPMIGAEERQALVRVLKGAHVVQGEQVAAFEREFADLVDGSLGSLLTDLVAQRRILIHPGGRREVSGPVVDALSAELAAWRDLVRAGERGVLATLEDGTRTATVADAVLRAASTSATITVEDEAA